MNGLPGQQRCFSLLCLVFLVALCFEKKLPGNELTGFKWADNSVNFYLNPSFPDSLESGDSARQLEVLLWGVQVWFDQSRVDLELDYEHGYDDWTFFNAEERVPDFVALYRKTLNRLAKT